MQKALSCANVNDKLANPLKLMAYTVHAALVGFTCKSVCKAFKHFAGHDTPFIPIPELVQCQDTCINNLLMCSPCSLPCFANTFTSPTYLLVSRTAEESKQSLKIKTYVENQITHKNKQKTLKVYPTFILTYHKSSSEGLKCI